MGKFHSELYTIAITQFLASQHSQALTEALNCVYAADDDSGIPADLYALQFYSLPQSDGWSAARPQSPAGVPFTLLTHRYNQSYTSSMKTAISIPDPIFEAAEAAAQRLGMSRSELYSTAISRFLESQNDQAITDALNLVYTTEEDSALPADLYALQFYSLPEDDWE